jgi:hypothetical protein
VLGVPLTIVQGSFLGVFGLSEPGLAHLCAVPLHGVLSEHKALGAASPLATNPFALLMAGEAASSLCGRTGEVRQYRKVDSSSLCSVEQFSGRSQPQAVGKAAWPSAPFQSPPHHRASWTVLRGEALLSDKGLCPFCTVQPRMECAGSYSKIGPPPLPRPCQTSQPRAHLLAPAIGHTLNLPLVLHNTCLTLSEPGSIADRLRRLRLQFETTHPKCHN